MPSAKATTPCNASKRVRTESARKREGRENAEALKRERAGQKAVAKARKDRRDEAADDDLLVEREEESPEMAKLRVYALKLESDNQRMKVKLTRRDERDDAPSPKTVPMPRNKSEIDVEVVRRHLGLLGEENDVKWSLIRHDCRVLLGAATLDWDKPWSRQDMDQVNTLFHALEHRHPDMRRFANHWGTEFIFKECFCNMYSYHQKMAQNKRDRSRSTPSASTIHTPALDGDDESDSDARKDAARKAAAHKAAAYRAADRKAAKRKADTQDNDEVDNPVDEDGRPYNDGETEIEDVPEETRKAIARDEIGVPGKLKVSTKVTLKPNPPGAPKSAPASENSEVLPSSSSAPARMSTSNPKPRPMIVLKGGRGGKVQVGRHGSGRGSAPVADVSPPVPSPRDDVVSSSSGQTTSESEED